MRWFLEGLGLGKLHAAFFTHSISFDMLPFMKLEEFNELGISIGQRVKIQQAYKELQSEGRTINTDNRRRLQTIHD